MDGKHITVVIASRPYPLKVKEDDEVAIRKIIKEINEKVNHFQLTYTNKDKQDCLSMALLTYAVDLYRSKISTAQDAVLTTKLANLEQILDGITDDG